MKPVVVKIGGSEGNNLDAVCDDIANLHAAGMAIVLVHGGSFLTNEIATALGHPPQFVTSPSGYTSRLTDRKTLEIFEMVYCGRLNKDIVERLQQRGVNAVGLSGLDGRLWSGQRKRAIRIVEDSRERILRDTYTGRVTDVNVHLLELLMNANYLPVLTPPAISSQDEAINVDGDRAAAATASALAARALLILSNVPGVLADFPDESSLIHFISEDELEAITGNSAQGRMRIKLLAATEALAGGIERIVIGDARIAAPISRALSGVGTTIEKRRENQL